MMDTVKSFKGYGKVDPVEEQAFRKKTRMRLIILVISTVVLLALIIGAVVGTVVHKKNNNKDTNDDPSSSPAAALKSVCRETQYPDSCYSSISALETSNITDPEELFKLSLRVAINSLDAMSSLPETLMKKSNDAQVNSALEVCQVVFDDAIDKLNDSLSSMEVNEGENILSVARLDDLKTWLSAAITDQETCLDALDEINATELLGEARSQMKNSTEYASNSLSIAAKILGILAKFNVPIHRKLLADDGFPEWVGSGDRRLLQAAKDNTRPDVTVAKDGSGDCRTIKEAVVRIPKKSDKRFVIYVKAGVYVENNLLDKSMWNVMIYGDGKDTTILSGSLNFIDGTPTFSTATFATAGKGFIAKDIGFRNTAGPQKHQAVAVRSGADFSVFYKCSFNAFQDTLYAHSNRQFYRECDIIGTVDFIFGNAAVVFQSCNILPRQPQPNQFVTITAQGKKDPNQNTGISIQKCTISAFDRLSVTTYLGRPWKEYSTTIVMQSNIGSFLHPLGWSEWIIGVEPPNTIFYAEYENTGPGASLVRRVKWAGYKTKFTAQQAARFTVQNFIQGSAWLPATKVLYESSL